MKFTAIASRCNWKTAGREGLPDFGGAVRVEQSVTDRIIYLAVRRTAAVELQLTPEEALALAAELLNAATQMRPTTETTR